MATKVLHPPVIGGGSEVEVLEQTAYSKRSGSSTVNTPINLTYRRFYDDSSDMYFATIEAHIQVLDTYVSSGTSRYDKVVTSTSAPSNSHYTDDAYNYIIPEGFRPIETDVNKLVQITSNIGGGTSNYQYAKLFSLYAKTYGDVPVSLAIPMMLHSSSSGGTLVKYCLHILSRRSVNTNTNLYGSICYPCDYTG